MELTREMIEFFIREAAMAEKVMDKIHKNLEAGRDPGADLTADEARRFAAYQKNSPAAVALMADLILAAMIDAEQEEPTLTFSSPFVVAGPTTKQ